MMELTEVEFFREDTESTEDLVERLSNSLHYFGKIHPDFSAQIEHYLEDNKVIVKICRLNEQCN